VSRGPGQHAARVLVVGEDAEVGSALHLQLALAGWAPVCLPGPELLEGLLALLAPQAIVLILPAAPAAAWGAALTTAATAALQGVRVIVVAPSREAVEPLAAVAGAERALARADVLAHPGSVLEGRAPPGRLSPPPLPARAAPGAPAPPAPRGAPREPPPAPAPTPDLAEATPALDLMSLIDEELALEPKQRPRLTRVEVNVSLVSEHNFYVGATGRVDSGGVFISTMLPPPVGTPLEICLGLPDTRKLDVQGEVVFLRDRVATGGRQPAGCGVRLHALPTWAAETIDRFLSARPPILYAP
jgi:PilZ domain